jgi:glucosamine--fructose-6-phosphate aminotransferase (isomerizing)
MAAIKLAKEHGAFVFGVCNVVGSSISRERTYTHAGPEMELHLPSVLTQITVLTMIALRLAKAKVLSHGDFHMYLQELEIMKS